jgi:hypothetical protein
VCVCGGGDKEEGVLPSNNTDDVTNSGTNPLPDQQQRRPAPPVQLPPIGGHGGNDPRSQAGGNQYGHFASSVRVLIADRRCEMHRVVRGMIGSHPGWLA